MIVELFRVETTKKKGGQVESLQFDTEKFLVVLTELFKLKLAFDQLNKGDK